MCSCVGGFSGTNCESECNEKKLIGLRFIIIVVNLGSILYFTHICTCNPPECCKQEFNRNTYTHNHNRLILSHSITILACPLTCENGGTLNETTCTCACADGYSGDTCGSECIMCHRFFFTTSHGICTGSQSYFNENVSQFTPKM